MNRWAKVGLSLGGLGLLVTAGAYLAGNRDSSVVWQDESYEAEWIDDPDLVMVDRKLPNGAAIGRIGPKVVAVASDGKFLTARVRSVSKAGVSDQDQYYYIEKTGDSDFLNGNEIAVGPLGKSDFDLLRSRLHLPEPVAF